MEATEEERQEAFIRNISTVIFDSLETNEIPLEHIVQYATDLLGVLRLRGAFKKGSSARPHRRLNSE
jgi:hypothetical protein